MPLQLLVSFFMRAEVVPDVVVEHFSATSHPIRFSPFSNRVTVAFLSIATIFTCYCSSFLEQQSVRKTLSNPLLLSLYTAPIKLLLFLLLSCVHTKTGLFSPCKRKKPPLIKLLVSTEVEHKMLRREQKNSNLL